MSSSTQLKSARQAMQFIKGELDKGVESIALARVAALLEVPLGDFVADFREHFTDPTRVSFYAAIAGITDEEFKSLYNEVFGARSPR